MPENYRLAGGTGWCIRMQRPHWPGRVTWRASLRFRSIFRELNLFDSTDLFCARRLATGLRVFRYGPGAFFRARVVSVNFDNDRSAGIVVQKREKGHRRSYSYRACACARHGGHPFMEETRSINSAPLFWRSTSRAVLPTATWRNLTVFFLSASFNIQVFHS